MPSYGGFRDIVDYLHQRCERDQIRSTRLSIMLGKQGNYIRSINKGIFLPSAPMCDALAEIFRDTPHLVRVLAGREAVPPKASKGLTELADVAAALSPADLNDLIDYARYLAWRRRK
jgi:hypothetical protein